MTSKEISNTVIEEGKLRPCTWDAFRKTGLLRFVNSFLHIFGWCLVFEFDEETGLVTRVYPARCSYDGFTRSEELNFAKLRSFMDTDEFFKANNKRRCDGMHKAQ